MLPEHPSHRTTDDSEHRKLVQLPIPSALLHLDFHASFVVVWKPGPAIYPAATRAVISYVQHKASKISPLYCELLATQLTSALAIDVAIGEPPVQVRAEDVRLQVTPEDLAFARKHADLGKARELRAAEREVQAADLEHLRKNVFTQDDTAALWWLLHNNLDITKLSSAKDTLHDLVKLVNAPRERAWADTLLDALRIAIPDLSPAQEFDLRMHISKALRVFGSLEVSQEFETRMEI